MIITAEVDSGEWNTGLDDLLARLEEAGREASLAGAEEIRDVARVGLSKRPHSEFTWSPSGAGQFPGMVSGALAASMSAELFGNQAWVGPTGLDYARIQELGGPMPTVRPGPMRFQKFGETGLQWWKLRFVQLDARPYLEPSTREVVDSGRLTEIYAEHWTAAIEEG